MTTKANKYVEAIGKAAVIEGLAEESAELAAAALKYSRKMRGNNPTAETTYEAQDKMVEEIADILNYLDLVMALPWFSDEVRTMCDRTCRKKMKRFRDRLEEAGKWEKQTATV